MLILFLRIRSAEGEHRALSFKTKLASMDLIGTVLFLGAICCLVLALQWGGQTQPWRSSQIIGLLIGFGLMTIVFVLVQYERGENALIPPLVLRQRSILIGQYSCSLSECLTIQ